MSDAYSWQELCRLTDEDVDNLLEGGWPQGKVPTLSELMAMRKGAALEVSANHVAHTDEALYGFDGSFGFSVGV